MPQMLVALDLQPRQTEDRSLSPEKRDAADTQRLLREVHRHYLPNTIVLLADGAKVRNFSAKSWRR